MQLPNELYSYGQSTLALLPTVLSLIGDREVGVIDIYQQMAGDYHDPSDFLAAMDCLYALRAIEMTEEGMVHRAN